MNRNSYLIVAAVLLVIAFALHHWKKNAAEVGMIAGLYTEAFGAWIFTGLGIVAVVLGLTMPAA